MKRIRAFLLCTTVLAVSGFAVAARAQSQKQAQAPAKTPAQTQQKTQAQAQAQAQAQQKTASAKPAAKKKKAKKYYNYANDESEYSVMLPEAPTVRTVWGQCAETDTYLLGHIPRHVPFRGEIATFARTNMDTEGTFTAKIMFLKTTDSFLAGLTEDKIKSILQKSYAHMVFINPTFHYSVSPGSGALKWATLSGFTVDQNHQPLFTATHYLTGLHSVFVVRVQFSVTNETYNKYYKKLVGSITYSPP